MRSMSDIKFINNNEIEAECFSLKLTGADLKIDYSPRRENNSPNRRALVHDYNDGLTINWAGDYPGGITLNGDVKISKMSGTHLRIHHHDLHLDNENRRNSSSGSRRALVHDFNDGLTINWANDYPAGVTIRGDVKCPEGLIVSGQDIITLIEDMQNTIQNLTDRIESIEAGG